MKPTQLPDAQVELLRWWRSKLGHAFAAAFLNIETAKGRGIPMQMVEGARLNPGNAFSEGWDGQYLSESEAHKLDRAPSYWVSQDMTSLVEHAAKSMPGQPLHETDLPSRAGFVWFEKQLFFPDVNGAMVGMRGVLWFPATMKDRHGQEVPGVVVSIYSDSREIGPDQNLASIPEDQRKQLPQLYLLTVTPWAFDYPYMTEADYVEGERFDSYAYVHSSLDFARRFLAAFWTIVQQPLATTTRTKPDRAAMRRAERGGFLGAQDEIKVVTLRKLKNKSADDAEHESIPVDWTHRWLVDGHWRNQWVPSLNMHRQTYIAPYIKGPSDRPLVLKDKVYKFAR